MNDTPHTSTTVYIGMNRNLCICCGVEIPEGRMVCPSCEHAAGTPAKQKTHAKKSLITFLKDIIR